MQVPLSYAREGFFVLKWEDRHELAAVLEWAISMLFIITMAAFAFDLVP
jgi:hypothetical protein